jgi:hypothetical protein
MGGVDAVGEKSTQEIEGKRFESKRGEENFDGEAHRASRGERWLPRSSGGKAGRAPWAVGTTLAADCRPANTGENSKDSS